MVSDGCSVGDLCCLLALLLFRGLRRVCIRLSPTLEASVTETSAALCSEIIAAHGACSGILGLSTVLRVVHKLEDAKNLIWFFGIDRIEELFEIKCLPNQEQVIDL